LSATEGAVGLVPTMTQVGYALGMLLIVPLGDLLCRRKLVGALLALVTLFLAVAAVAPNVAVLAGVSLAIGVTTSVPQILVPLATQLTAPARRGKVIGTVMMGLLLGVLLSRTLSGVVGAQWGWRSVYWMGAGLMLATVVVVVPLLPADNPRAPLTYGQLLRSVYALARTRPPIRAAMLNGGLLFGAFCAFWATLAFRLELPPLHYGAATAGAFGAVGALGALAAPWVGRIADRAGPRALVTWSTAGILVSYLIFWATGHTLIGLAAGVIVVDVAMQSAQVTNMTRIYAAAPDAPSRANAAYMVAYFVGGSLGSLLATRAWAVGQWGAVCGLGVAMPAVGLVVHLFSAGGAEHRVHRPCPTAVPEAS
jgi:predicted MFS family arabinose efflux permease